MSELSSVDRLNIIFFGEMEIPVDEKKRRIAFAKALQAVLWKYYDTIHTILEISFSNDAESAIVPLAVAAAALEREYKRLIEKYYPEVADISPDWVIAHTRQFSVWTTKNKNRTLVADKDAIFCCFLGNTDYLRKPSFLTIAR